MNTKTALITFAALTLIGCGAPNSSGVAVFKTSTVSASIDKVVLESDTRSWVDSTSGAKVISCTTAGAKATIPPSDNVNVTITATGFEKTNTTRDPLTGGLPVKSLPVLVEKATITYAPANAGAALHPLPTQFRSFGQVINISQTVDPPSGSLVVPISVVPTEMKQSLTALECSSDIYNYYVTIAVDVTEVGTNTRSTIETKMTLWLSDYIDK